MSARSLNHDEAPDLLDREEISRTWPAFMHHDPIARERWRAHARLGAEIVGVRARSMTVRGTVAQWEHRGAGMPFPETGSHVVPGVLSPVAIDVEADQELYVEPSVRMRHRLA